MHMDPDASAAQGSANGETRCQLHLPDAVAVAVAAAAHLLEAQEDDNRYEQGQQGEGVALYVQLVDELAELRWQTFRINAPC